VPRVLSQRGVAKGSHGSTRNSSTGTHQKPGAGRSTEERGNYIALHLFEGESPSTKYNHITDCNQFHQRKLGSPFPRDRGTISDHPSLEVSSSGEQVSNKQTTAGIEEISVFQHDDLRLRPVRPSRLQRRWVRWLSSCHTISIWLLRALEALRTWRHHLPRSILPIEIKVPLHGVTTRFSLRQDLVRRNRLQHDYIVL